MWHTLSEPSCSVDHLHAQQLKCINQMYEWFTSNHEGGDSPCSLCNMTQSKNIFKFYAELECAAFTYKRWCHLRHVEVLRMKMTCLSFSESGILPKWQRTASWEPCLKEKNCGRAKLCHFDWLGSIEAEDNGKKLGQHLDSSAPWGLSVLRYSAHALFFNLSNYLACLSFCFCSYRTVCTFPPCSPLPSFPL